MKVLVVDDDRGLLDLIEFSLQGAGFEVATACDTPGALERLGEFEPDILLLDINLGGWSGLDLLKELRGFTTVPAIMLSARSAEEDKVMALEMGADDYLTKPFGHRELLARVRAVLRRAGKDDHEGPPRSGVLRVGRLVINAANHTVTKDGLEVSVSVTEFRLLHCLGLDAGRVVAQRALLKQIWGYDDGAGAEALRVAVYRLRRKLEDDPALPTLILTIPGVGVILQVPDPSAGA